MRYCEKPNFTTNYSHLEFTVSKFRQNFVCNDTNKKVESKVKA